MSGDLKYDVLFLSGLTARVGRSNCLMGGNPCASPTDMSCDCDCVMFVFVIAVDCPFCVIGLSSRTSSWCLMGVFDQLHC